MWQPGDNIVLRGMFRSQPWHAQSVTVVKDTPEEVALLLLPGAECVAPWGYIHQKHGDDGHSWERWQTTLSGIWSLEKYRWHTNRFLILLEPEKYFASIYIWEHAINIFRCYYVNFQLPFTYSHCGIDTFDLELDIVIDPAYQWRWKDVDDYQKGIAIAQGGICPEWVEGIEKAKPEVLDRLEKRLYPLNGAWRDWRPDPAWIAPQLPANWDRP